MTMGPSWSFEYLTKDPAWWGREELLGWPFSIEFNFGIYSESTFLGVLLYLFVLHDYNIISIREGALGVNCKDGNCNQSGCNWVDSKIVLTATTFLQRMVTVV